MPQSAMKNKYKIIVAIYVLVSLAAIVFLFSKWLSLSLDIVYDTHPKLENCEENIEIVSRLTKGHLNKETVLSIIKAEYPDSYEYPLDDSSDSVMVNSLVITFDKNGLIKSVE